MKIIKRYANRKLYDTESSAYVTLEELAQMVREGVEFTILDNRTKKDLTSLTLAQILCEEEKKQSSAVPLTALRSLIRTGEDFFQRKVRAPLSGMRDRTQETVERIIGRTSEGEGEPGAAAGAMDPPVMPDEGLLDEQSVSNPDLRPALREFFEHFHRTLEESLHGVDEQVHRVLDSVAHLPELQQQIAVLSRQLEEMEGRVMELEARMASRGSETPESSEPGWRREGAGGSPAKQVGATDAPDK